MFLDPQNRNDGTKNETTVPKKGTRTQKRNDRHQKPEREYIRQNHPFIKPPFCFLSSFQHWFFIQDTFEHDRGQKSAILARRLHCMSYIFSNGFYPFSPGGMCNLVRKWPENLEKVAKIAGGEIYVKSCHVSGRRGFSCSDLLISLICRKSAWKKKGFKMWNWRGKSTILGPWKFGETRPKNLQKKTPTNSLRKLEKGDSDNFCFHLWEL